MSDLFSLPSFVDIYFISVALFCGILAALIYRDRKNIEFHYILLIRRTQHGKKLIDRIAQASPMIWKLISTVFVLLAFYFMASGLYTMIMAAKLIVERTLTMPALQLVIPLPRPKPISGPGYLLVPFWFWIILVPFFMFPHEISHGIIARAHKIRLKSVGLLLLAVIPGAFVEPDDKQIKRAKALTKLRIFSAGSIANIIVVFIFILIASQIIWPSIYAGLTIVDVNENAPAGKAGLKAGMKLEKIDDKPVSIEYNDFELAYSLLLMTSSNVTINNTKALGIRIAMYKILSKYKPGDKINIVADSKVYELVLGQHPANSTLPYIGVTLRMDEKRAANFEFSTLLPLLWWITTIGYAVAIFNLLPIYPLDGGLMVEAVASYIFRKEQKVKQITRCVTIATLGLVAFNFIGPYILQSFA